MSTGKLTGTVAFISGGSQGVGAASARALAGQGVSLYLIARDVDKLAAVRAECLEAGAPAVHTRSVDVTDSGALKEAIDHCAAVYGRLDHLIVAAGINRRKDPLQADVHVWDHLVRVDLSAAMHAARFALDHIVAGGRGGTIVFMSSLIVRGLNPFSGDFVGLEAYNAAKSGLNGFARSLFGAVAAKGVRVCCVNFGLTATALGTRPAKSGRGQLLSTIPPQMMIQPEDIGAVALWCCSQPVTMCPTEIDVSPMFTWHDVVEQRLPARL